MIFQSRMAVAPFNRLTLPAEVRFPSMHELWDFKTHEGGRPLREYCQTLWTAKTVRRKPSPVNGFPGTLILAQRDLPDCRQIYFHDLGLQQRIPGAYRCDALTLLPACLRWRNRKISFEDRAFWESQQAKWLEYWRNELGSDLPMREPRRFGIRHRFRHWWSKSGYRAVLASEMEIKVAGYFDWAKGDYSYFRETMIEVPANGVFRHAFKWNEEPMMFATIFEPMQIEAGLKSLWQRVWYVRHDSEGSEHPQHLDCVDAPNDRDLFVNHLTLCPGQNSEVWNGVTVSLTPQTRASGPRRREIEWIRNHRPAT